jgi:crotonyl-CoA carboxylase/reductase
MSRAFTWEELPLSHQLMYENKHPSGNMAILVGAPDFGLGKNVSEPVAITPTATAEITSDDEYRRPSPAMPEPEMGLEGDMDRRLVRDMMHYGVIACALDTPVNEVARRMTSYHVHAIVVTDSEGFATGIVSQTDVVLARQGRGAEELAQLTAGDIMTAALITCTPDSTVAEAITLMARNRIHRLVVVDTRAGKPWPVGVLSMTDIITYGMSTEPTGEGAMALPPTTWRADIYEPMAPEPALAGLDLAEDTTLVRDVMHLGVVTCTRDTSLVEVARTMYDQHIHAIVVVDDEGRAAGVVSQTDVVLARQGRTASQAAVLKAGDILTPSLVSCTPDRKLSDAITEMTRNRVHRLVVVDERGGRLMPVGILSMTDVIRQLIEA